MLSYDGDGRPALPSFDRRRLAQRENAAHESHQWVRLTRCCNNRCGFCLDADTLDGTHVPMHTLRRQILQGRRRGATRLILSGGEPTVHPSFVDLIALGRRLGYRKVQTISNGRMFSYRRFLTRCLEAGLGEITFSVHGHRAELHDRLVGVPGAFRQTVAGLEAALADGRAVVNIDVCLNRANVRHLPELLDRFMAMGVREFDLLQIIPFGRAAAGLQPSSEELGPLFYDIDEAMPAIRYALELARRPDVHIWLNRFPPPFLEGHEHLIQDPHKLTDEVRGRQRELTRWLNGGEPVPCRQTARCRACCLVDLCDALEQTRHGLAQGAFDIWRVRADADSGPPPVPCEACWVVAPDAGAAGRAAASVDCPELILELDEVSGLPQLLQGDSLAGKRLSRVYVRRPEHLVAMDQLLSTEPCPATFGVVAILDKAMAASIPRHHGQAPPWLAVTMENHARLTQAVDAMPDLHAFFRGMRGSLAVHNVPECISGIAPQRPPRILDADILGPGGTVDVNAFAARFIVEHSYTKSRRCTTCARHDRCRGAHINFVRAVGYGVLQPIPP
jgi:MoaA/NifB/PqqE/SkfB family radical SAM enzyme